MTSIGFDERMTGFATFGESDYNEGLRRGRIDDTIISFDVHIELPDIDAFLADSAVDGSIVGTIDCGALGGKLAIERGIFNAFVPAEGDEHHGRMRYRLFARDRDDRPITLSGFKDVADGLGFDVWSDTSTLFMRLFAGHVEADAEFGEAGDKPEVMAAGVLRISHPEFLRTMASMRGRGGPPWRRAAAVARYQRAFIGTLFHVYGGKARKVDQPDFPDPAHPVGDPFRGQKAGEWRDIEGQPGLRRRIFEFRAGDGLPLTLHNVRGADEPTRAPVLCIHGTGVRGEIFVGSPGGSSTAQALVAAGHDVWITNWRASIDLPPRSYTLDQGAVFDHPAAIAEVRRLTQTDKISVLAHCQGSTSFTMTALAGLAGDVTHVVSSAVSLHTVVPRKTRMKGRFVLPLLGLRMPYISAQWAVRSPSVLATFFARTARVVRRECDNPVCAMGNYMYGTGPDVLWVHEKLGERAHDWTSREFGFAPYTFLRQMYYCTKAGHLIPRDSLPVMPDDLLAAPIPRDQRWTFIAGSRNRLYLPEGQKASWTHFEAGSGGSGIHVFHELEGYGHLDPLLGPGAPVDVFPKILAGLDDDYSPTG